MSLVQTEITLRNAGDIIRAKDGNIKETEVRQITVQALVDTGAWTLVINEATRLELFYSSIILNSTWRALTITIMYIIMYMEQHSAFFGN